MFKQHLPAPQHIWPRGRRRAAKGPHDASLIGKSIQQMDVWGLVTLIYQFLMPRFVSRVPRCCRGKIGANGVIRLLAQGSGSSWGSGRAAGALPAARAFWRGWQGGTEEGVHCTRVHARNDSFQARDGDGDQLLGLLLAHWLPGVLPSPKHRRSCSRAMGTHLQLHLHPIHRQHLILKEKRSSGEAACLAAAAPRLHRCVYADFLSPFLKLA